MKAKLTLALACILASRAVALDLDAFTGKFGVAVVRIAPTSSGEAIAPSPLINTLGMALNMRFAPDFFLSVEPSLDIL